LLKPPIYAFKIINIPSLDEWGPLSSNLTLLIINSIGILQEGQDISVIVGTS